MRTSISACAIIAFAVLLVVPCRADEQGDVRGIIDKAIKAAGGEARLSKVKAVTWKGRGTQQYRSAVVSYAGSWAIQPPARSKNALEIEYAGIKIPIVAVLDGEQGWIKTRNRTEEMNSDRLASAREQLYADWVASLLPLRDKAFTLSPLGESKVGDRTAVGVKVARQGRPDIRLFFDKQTGLLIKTEARLKDETGIEVNQETFLGEQQDIEGIKQATRILIKRNGNVFLDGEMYDFAFEEKLDEGIFAKP